MPYKGGKRKKRRTHKEPGVSEIGKVARTLVIRRGKVPKNVVELVSDLRDLMMPHTAPNLRERASNSIQDFVAVAGPLGVTHFMILSQTTANNVVLRVARTPHGPTLTFRVDAYTLGRQVRASQAHAVDMAAAFESPPLVVLHGFGNLPEEALRKPSHLAGVSLADALKMTTTVFQNMFPQIQPATVKLAQCRRIALIHYDRERNVIELRHYYIRAVPVGMSRAIKKLTSAHLPDLGGLEDVSEFVLSGGRRRASGAGSETEGEEEGAKVVLPQDYAGLGNRKSSQSSIKLSEIGPRLTLSLVKVEAQLCKGEVLYHAFVSKTAEEAAALRAAAARKEQLKVERRQKQEENVARKKAEAEAKKAAKAERRAARQEAAKSAAASGTLADEEDADDDDEEDDASAAGSAAGSDADDGYEGDEAGDAEEEEDDDEEEEEEEGDATHDGEDADAGRIDLGEEEDEYEDADVDDAEGDDAEEEDDEEEENVIIDDDDEESEEDDEEEESVPPARAGASSRAPSSNAAPAHARGAKASAPAPGDKRSRNGAAVSGKRAPDAASSRKSSMLRAMQGKLRDSQSKHAAGKR